MGGVPKAMASWLRSWWLSHIDAGDFGRPPHPASTTAYTVHLVESWAPPASGSTRKLHAYSNAPFVALSVNGVPFGAPLAMADFSSVTWSSVPWAAGNVTVTALAAPGGAALATHTKFSWGAPASVVLTIDAPSPASGTGSAVYLDGTDVALLRATVVDAAGHRCDDATLNVTFTCVTGPCLVLGAVNGDPANHDPNGAPWKPAYHGTVRGIVRANMVAVGDRATLAAVNTDAGVGGTAATLLPPGGVPPTTMTVSASAPGLQPSSIVIALSVNPSDEVMAVASASVGTADVGQ